MEAFIMKNTLKLFLLGILTLGLQPYALMGMEQKPEEITEVPNTTPQEEVIIFEEKSDGTTATLTETDKKTWLQSLPQLPNVATLATQAVHTIVVNPFHNFVDSHYGGTLPGGFLALDYAYSSTLGNPYNEALTRKTVRLFAWGLLAYKTYRWSSAMDQIKAVLHRHTTQLDQILITIDKKKTELEVQMNRLHQETQKKLNILHIEQKKHTTMLEDLSNKTTTINSKLDGIEKNMATSEQIEQLNTKITVTEKTTGNLTDMFQHFMQQSATSHSDIKKVLSDTSEIKMNNKEILDNQVKSEKALEISLQQQSFLLKQQEEFINKQKEMMLNLGVVLNMHSMLNKPKKTK
jgi:hypothetical protein